MSYLLIVEDSKVDCGLIVGSLPPAVAGVDVRCVTDPYLARDMIAEEDPYFVILDIELPRMSGGEFLGHLMRNHPLPVIVVTRAVDNDLGRMEKMQLLGAVQTIYKPKTPADMSVFVAQLQQCIETITRVQGKPDRRIRSKTTSNTSLRTRRAGTSAARSSFDPNPVIIALGASTGGPAAIREILRHFSANSPPILIAQHISSRFLSVLVSNLQRTSDLRVTVAEHGMLVESGGAYIAPPEHHMEIDIGGRIKLLSTLATDKVTPSINILFNSLARSNHTTVIAALLTGMGSDGADGLLRLRQTGASTIAEHSSTCVVYGMPARAVEIGAAEEVVRLPEIGPRMLELVLQLGDLKQPRTMMVSHEP